MTNLKTVLFTSRNKDNTHVKGFKRRSKSFVVPEDKDLEELMEDFTRFVNVGLPGEMSRFYVSVDSYCNEDTKRNLQHYLLDNDFPLYQLEQKVCSLAAKSKRTTHKFLFDYDNTEENLEDFLALVKAHMGEGNSLSVTKTPNGFAVVTERGFDSREVEKFPEVELKRNAELFVAAKRRLE